MTVTTARPDPKLSRNLPQTAARVRTVLVQDADGMLQVIVPTAWLLDLKLLQKVTGRALLPVRQDELLDATRRQLLQQLDFVPACFLMPTVIEESLALHSYCEFEIFEVDGPSVQKVVCEELLSQLTDEGFRVQTLPCALPPDALNNRVAAPAADTRQIRESLQNFTALRIRQRLEETLEIPPLSGTAQRILKLRSNPNASVNELVDIVEADPSLSAQVVSWAASPYYAAPGKIQSVQDAIVRVLGFSLVSNLAVGLVLGRSISLPRDGVEGITPYWLQAVYCSTAAEAIFRLLPPPKRPSQGLVYLAGLLHNFGYLVLAHTFRPQFSQICRHAEANPAISHVAIEHHLIGVSREQMGAWLMQCWNMPEELTVALRFQHDPDYAGEHSIYAHLVHIALRLLRGHGIGDAPPGEVPDSLYLRYGLDPQEAADAVAGIVASEEIKRIADHLPR